MAQKYYKKDKPITAQEGDFPAPIPITVPGILPIDGYVVTFQVTDSSGRVIIKKKSDTGGIVVAGQIIRVDFVKADTLGKAGQHRWELEVRKGMEEEITIGGGPFIILPTTIK